MTTTNDPINPRLDNDHHDNDDYNDDGENDDGESSPTSKDVSRKRSSLHVSPPSDKHSQMQPLELQMGDDDDDDEDAYEYEDDEYYSDNDDDDVEDDDSGDNVYSPSQVDDYYYYHDPARRFFTAQKFASFISLISTVPLLLFMYTLYDLLGRTWVCTPTAFHLVLELMVGSKQAKTPRVNRGMKFTTKKKQSDRDSKYHCCSCSTAVIVVQSILDMWLFGTVYPTITWQIVTNLFMEPDGTVAVEWTFVSHTFEVIRKMGFLIVALRGSILLGLIISAVRESRRKKALSQGKLELNGTSFADEEDEIHLVQGDNPRDLMPTTDDVKEKEENGPNDGIQLGGGEEEEVHEYPKQHGLLLGTCRSRIGDCFLIHQSRIQWSYELLLSAVKWVALALFIWSVTSAGIHIPSWKAPNPPGADRLECDPLDLTECSLPFPSSYHLVKDSTTETGWRVNLSGNSLPPLKGNIRMDPSFLNKLDGFSTMAPILFYIDGLKEAHEQGTGDAQLQGAGHIEKSITSESITLLFDVAAKKLVPHIAEIDYLDKNYPLVVVTPAQPLNHNTRYALAVVNAVDVNGKRLPRTQGLTTLLHSAVYAGSTPATTQISERSHRFRNELIPALTAAAPCVDYEKDPSSLQLIFDFHTASASSQLGSVRAVRDAMLDQISSAEWGGWGKHNVNTIKVIDGDCTKGRILGRTIHAELKVPWFLNDYGVGHRAAVLDDAAVSRGRAYITGWSKFVIYVPCSVKAGALNDSDGVDVRAIIEYGHGLFYHREEASDLYLLQMANDNGYLIMAMDWRGMSQFDLPIVIKTLMSTPRLFHAVRDNLIQGYANKLALQHFSQNGMLSMDWFQFNEGGNTRTIATVDGSRPQSLFYGISQGGILGAGYSALMGKTGLIDRSILGVPGTPFSLIIPRSLDFTGYDEILLLNFYHNRHVRIFLSIVQMAWDPVEGSGVLAGPVEEPYPRVLMQAGLGDAEVPTIAAEALSRAFGASTLPGNPRHVYDLPTNPAANATSDGPNCVLTEILYEEDYASLPDEVTMPHSTDVHYCVRLDPALKEQVVEFINTGRIIDPCESDNCKRKRASCHT